MSMRSAKRRFNTKIHLAVDAHGMPVHFFVTDATVADCSVAEALIAKFKAEYLLAPQHKDLLQLQALHPCVQTKNKFLQWESSN